MAAWNSITYAPGLSTLSYLSRIVAQKPENIQDMEHIVLFSTQQTETQQNPLKNAIAESVPRLYNSLPKYLIDIKSVKTEKFEDLEKFLRFIHD